LYRAFKEEKSMKVKNNYQAPVGFGDVTILPGDTAELPAAYTENNGTIKNFVKRGWLTVVKGKTPTASAEATPDATATGGTPEGDIAKVDGKKGK
jgi:hypothetical protein